MKNILIFILLLLSYSSFGQRVCGTPSTVLNSNPTISKAFTSHTFKIYYHIIAKNNGNQPTASLTDILAAHSALNSRFIGSNICFELSGYGVIEDNYLHKWKVVNDYDIDPLKDELFGTNVQSDAINVYIIDADEDREANKIQNGQLNPLKSTPEGAAEAIISHSLYIKKEKLTSEILSHEMGHVLGLYHTFEELANGIDDPNTNSDDDEKGDLIPDTPEQPFSCKPLDANCNLPCTLPYNTTALLSNYMNYSDNLSCLTTFTSDQKSRMHSIINGTSDLTQRLVPINRTINALNIPFPLPFGNTINDMVQEAKLTLTLGDVNIQSPGKGAFRAEEEIIVLPGFDALEGCRALLIIENICKAGETQAKDVNSIVEYYENEGFRIDIDNEEFETYIQTQLETDLSQKGIVTFPNPFEDVLTISINTDLEYDANTTVLIEIHDLNGKSIISTNCTFRELSSDFEIETNLLQKGVYIVNVSFSDERFVSRIVKQ